MNRCTKHTRPIVGYRIHNGLKFHFYKTNYNIFTNGFPKIGGDTFDSRNDAKIYAIITTKLPEDEVFYYFLANVLQENNNCLYNFSGEGNIIYKDYKRKIESLSYNFYDELATISFDISGEEELYQSADNEQPLIIKYLIGGLISLETFCLIQLHCHDIINIQYHDYLWDLKKQFIRKYLPFFSHKYIKYDSNVIQKYYKDVIGGI